MKTINEIPALDFQVKFGEMKCNANEVRYLLHVVEQINEILFGQLFGELTADEQKQMKQNLNYVEYFQNKYLYLASLRNKEKESFDMMKTMQDKLKFCKNENDKKQLNEIVVKFKQEYENIKAEREQLSSELSALKQKKYSGVFF